jgi:hypothetical protein
VAHHDDEPRREGGGGEFHAAHLRGRHDVPGDADDEQVAEPLAEDELGRDAGIRAPQDDRERPLVLRRIEAPRSAEAEVGIVQVLDEAAVAFLEPSERFVSRDQAV